MNHRKLHLLKPTVYSHCHSNPRLVKTEPIHHRLSRAWIPPEAPPACAVVPARRAGQGGHRHCAFLRASRPFLGCVCGSQHPGIACMRPSGPQLVRVLHSARRRAEGSSSGPASPRGGGCQPGPREPRGERRCLPLSRLFFSSLLPLVHLLRSPFSPCLFLCEMG